MKLKNILFSLLAVLTTLLGVTVKASTTAPSSYTLDPNDLYRIDASYYLSNSTISMFYKKTTDGKVVYCTESHDLVVSHVEKYTLEKELDARFAYILANGHPTKYITGNDTKDYLITALAIWYTINPNDSVFTYFNLDAGTYRGGDSDIVREMAKLVNGSKNYAQIDPTIKLNGNSGLTLSSDGKYYVSSNIGITKTGTITNNSYTVTLENAPSGSIITDANGNVKSTFNANETFLVKVPVTSIKSLSTSFNVIAKATGTINRAYLYAPTTNSAFQSTAALYPENKDLSTSLNLKVSLSTEVEISKVDATTGEELPGAELTLKDASGKVIDTWVSGKEPHIIKGLSFGKYYLTEVNAPDGYVLSTETIEFEITSENSSVKVVMKNTPEEIPEIPEIYISKQDITTGEELPGAHLELYDEEDNLVEAWVSGEEPHKIKGLEPGKYYLKETLSPDGYELSTEIVEFIVKEDGTVDGDIIMYNKPETYIHVPNTSSFKTITASLIGIVIIGLGSMIIYKNYKKNEEN